MDKRTYSKEEIGSIRSALMKIEGISKVDTPADGILDFLHIGEATRVTLRSSTFLTPCSPFTRDLVTFLEEHGPCFAYVKYKVGLSFPEGEIDPMSRLRPHIIELLLTDSALSGSVLTGLLSAYNSCLMDTRRLGGFCNPLVYMGNKKIHLREYTVDPCRGRGIAGCPIPDRLIESV